MKRQSATNKATTWLTHVHPIVYKRFYIQEKSYLLEGQHQAIAQSRAKTRLRRKYSKKDYRELYLEAVSKGYSV